MSTGKRRGVADSSGPVIQGILMLRYLNISFMPFNSYALKRARPLAVLSEIWKKMIVCGLATCLYKNYPDIIVLRKYYVGLEARKPVFGVCEQQRRRPA